MSIFSRNKNISATSDFIDLLNTNQLSSTSYEIENMQEGGGNISTTSSYNDLLVTAQISATSVDFDVQQLGGTNNVGQRLSELNDDYYDLSLSGDSIFGRQSSSGRVNGMNTEQLLNFDIINDIINI